MNHFIILFCCGLLAVGVQCKAVYRMKIARAEIARCNKSYMEGRVWVTKPSRYTNAVKIQLYEFLSNEYRPFAIKLERRLCHFLTLEYKLMFYPDLLKIGAHMLEPSCPVKPGNYSFANFIPDIDNYPSTLPFHNFMFEVGMWHGPVEMTVLRVYGILDRDAIIREQYE